jgi:hypothetical protein
MRKPRKKVRDSAQKVRDFADFSLFSRYFEDFSLFCDETTYNFMCSCYSATSESAESPYNRVARVTRELHSYELLVSLKVVS